MNFRWAALEDRHVHSAVAISGAEATPQSFLVLLVFLPLILGMGV